MQRQTGSVEPMRNGWGGARKGAGGRRGPGPATIRRHRFIIEWVSDNFGDCADDMFDFLGRKTDRALYVWMSAMLFTLDPEASLEMAKAAMNIPVSSQRRYMLDRTARFVEARENRRHKKEMKKNPAKSQSETGRLGRQADRSRHAHVPAPAPAPHPGPARSAL